MPLQWRGSGGTILFLSVITIWRTKLILFKKKSVLVDGNYYYGCCCVLMYFIIEHTQIIVDKSCLWVIYIKKNENKQPVLLWAVQLFSFFNQRAVWQLRLKIHTCNVCKTPHIYCPALLQGRCKLPAALWKSQLFLNRNDRTQCEHAERLERVLRLDF